MFEALEEKKINKIIFEIHQLLFMRLLYKGHFSRQQHELSDLRMPIVAN